MPGTRGARYEEGNVPGRADAAGVRGREGVVALVDGWAPHLRQHKHSRPSSPEKESSRRGFEPRFEGGASPRSNPSPGDPPPPRATIR
ncbi:hypothetical protein ACHAWF_003407 [Thalassiosira exigua]